MTSKAPAAQHQRQLQPEELVEGQPAAGRLDHAERLGAVDGPRRPPCGPTGRARRRHSSGSGSANSPGPVEGLRRRTRPISQRGQRRLGRGRVDGEDPQRRGRPGCRSPATTSTTGFTIWRVPGTRPPCRRRWPRCPPASCLARHGWLKKTTARRPVSSLTDHVDDGAARPGPTRRWAGLHRGQHRRLVPHLPVRRRRPAGCGRCSGGGRW